MPATSDKQRKFMNVVAAAQKGDKGVTGAAKKAAKTMTKKSVQDFAHTKGKLPKKAVKESITMQQPVMQQPVMQQMQQQMPSHEHPGCEDKVGQICVVMRPGPEDSPADIVHPTHVFGMQQFDPTQVHGIYGDEEEANMVAEAACNELYKHMKEVEDKKHAVTEKIERMIAKMQREVNNHMKAGNDPKAQMMLEKISGLRNRHKMVQSSKKELKPREEK